jgi:hypothetical protein
MHVDYRPVGKNHRVIAVLEVVDGRPAREISIRKYIRMLKKQGASKDPLAPRLKPLKNVLREYLKANPEYANRLRLQDARDKGAVQITDGKFVLKQLALDELREFISTNESFVELITYRQIARQTENFKTFGSTVAPDDAPKGPAKRDIETPILAEAGGARAWFNAHALIFGACALLLLLGSIALVVVRTRGRALPVPSVNLGDPSSVELMIQRCEAATRLHMAQVMEDPAGVSDAMRQTRRFLAEAEKANLTPGQAKRVEAIRYRLDKLEGVADAAQAK